MNRLVLFDIDGTLLSAQHAPRRAFHRALMEVFGTAGPIDGHTFDGKTDPQIARELLLLAGLPDEAISRGLPDLWSTYLRELARELALPGQHTLVYPGVRELLIALESMKGYVLLGLLTGNIQPGAALKLASAKIATDFRVGAFGSDHERRDQLPALAVARALDLTGVHFRERDVVIVGDTPSDVTCGRSLAVRTLGVATGRHDETSLRAAGADHVFADLSATDEVLRAMLD